MMMKRNATFLLVEIVIVNFFVARVNAIVSETYRKSG